MTKGKRTPQQNEDEQTPLENQVAELTAALQRERADAINLRRRTEEQIANVRQNVKAAVVTDLLPVIDNLERALKYVPADLEQNEYIKGVQGIVRQCEKVLETMGVQRIESVGKSFDPRFHEAVSMDEGDGDHEIVSEELQAGYKIGDTVLRHAMVRVKSE